jgi:alkanesulfonate monooxygenase SsuD/methylene tetrahydromethanopterin reductase-like flavin-dependent oxidoreductase (luciferase family)
MWSVDYALGTAQEAVKRGAEKTGRDAQQIDLQSYVVISVDEDEKQALDRARAFVAFYGAFAQYYDYFEQHGFGDVVQRLSEAAKTQSCAEYAHLVPDEMVRTFTASGTREQVEEWIEPLWQKASTVVLGIPVWGLAAEEIAKAQIAAESFVKSSA